MRSHHQLLNQVLYDFIANIIENAIISFLDSEAISLSSIFHHNSTKIDALIQIWLHLSIFQDNYEIKVNGLHQIFNFYSNLKGFHQWNQPTRSQPDQQHAMHLYSELAVRLVQTILQHYCEYEMEKGRDKQSTPFECVQDDFFELIGIDGNYVSRQNWPYIASYLFRNYYIEPDFNCSSPLYQRVCKAFSELRETGITHLKANHKIYILYVLIDMANRTSMVRLCDFNHV